MQIKAEQFVTNGAGECLPMAVSRAWAVKQGSAPQLKKNRAQ